MDWSVVLFLNILLCLLNNDAWEEKLLLVLLYLSLFLHFCPFDPFDISKCLLQWWLFLIIFILELKDDLKGFPVVFAVGIRG